MVTVLGSHPSGTQAAGQNAPASPTPQAGTASEPPAHGPNPNQPALPRPNAPSGGSFEGTVSSQSGFIPPDVGMAAGPTTIVAVSNGVIDLFSKDGATFGQLLSSQTLDNFFSAVKGAGGTFDPHAVYDPYQDLFWIVAATADNTSGQSRFVVAVSNDSTGLNGWTTFFTDARLDGSGDSHNWCDYPQIGIDAQAVYFTCNEFSFPVASGTFQYAKIRVMTKDQFLGAPVTVCCTWWDFWNLREGFLGIHTSFTIQPATMYGASTSDGEYLIDAHGDGGNDDTLEVFHITNPDNCCNGSSGPNLDQNSQGVGSFDAPPGGREPGTNFQFDTGDSRLLYAFWRKGVLTTGQNLDCSGVACLGFTQLNVSNFPNISTVNDWTFGSGDDRFYPAVAQATNTGNMTMVYTRSGPNTFAEVDQIGIDPSGAFVDQEQTVHSGGNTYISLDGDRNRWGDFFSASPDPDGSAVWVDGEFAGSDPCQCDWRTAIELTRPPENVTTLAPFRPVAGGPNPLTGTFNDFYQADTNLPVSANLWNAIGIREGADGTSVADTMFLFGDPTLDHLVKIDFTSPADNEYLLINNHLTPAGPYFPNVQPFTAGGPYSIEYAPGSINLGGGVTGQSNDLIRVYDAFLTSGTTYFVGLRPNAGTTSSYTVNLHSASSPSSGGGGPFFQSRNDAVVSSGRTTVGQPAFLTFNTGTDPSQPDAIVVVNNNGGAGTYGLFVDTAAPSGSIAINGGAAFTHNADVTLTLTATNPTSGDPVSDMHFSTDGFNFGPFQPFTRSVSLGLPSGEGSKTLFVQFRNGAGAVSATARASITLDTTPPTTVAGLSGLQSGSTFVTPVQVTLTAVDTLSGNASTVFQIDGGATQTYSAPFTVSTNGTHTVTFHGTDRAGNVESTKSISFTIANVATATPTPTRTSSPTTTPTRTNTPTATPPGATNTPAATATAGAGAWVSQTSGTTNTLKAVTCASATACEIAGANGTLLGTTAGGSPWSAQASGTASWLYGAACPSSSTCFAVGSGGTIRATTNGGASWAAQTSGTANRLRAIACPSTSTCVAVGDAGTIVGTINGGASWSAQSSGVASILYGVACPGATTCYAVGDGGVIRATTNGGGTWSPQSSGIAGAFYGVACPSVTTCYAVGVGGAIRATTNGGGIWSGQSSGTGTNLNSVSCPSASACTVAGNSGTILGTTNGGGTWSPQAGGTANNLNAVRCPGVSTCYAVGDNGTILKFTGGVPPTATPTATATPNTTWIAQTSGITTSLKGVSCPDTLTCAAVGAAGTILHTTNGGASWAAQASGTVRSLFAVNCPTASVCEAVGAGGTIVGTTNGGATWAAQASGTTNNLRGVSCVSATTCEAAGDGGTIVGTTNGGATWAAQASGTAANLNALGCVGTTTCLAVGASGTILGTTNTGGTWAPQTSGTTRSLFGVKCAGASLCWAVGFGGEIRTTTNGGATWTAQTGGTASQLNGANCSGSSVCVAVGAGGTIVATGNAGATWAAQASGTANNLNGVRCASTTICFAVGDGGTILRCG